MAWYASVAKVGHSTSGLTTKITFRMTQRCDGASYDLNGWRINYSTNTGASGYWDAKINKNSTITKDVVVSVNHNSNTGVAPNVTFTATNMINGDYISSKVNRSASFQPPTVSVTKVPPQVSNVKLTRNSDSQLTINWTNNGSGNTAPNHNYVDIKTDDGSWVCIHNGGIKTSHVWTGASKGHKYQARVNSGNSAGHNTHVESNIVYTAPEPLKDFSDARVIIVDVNKSLSVNFDSSNVKYTSNKIEMQYSNDNSVWRGVDGTIDSVYTFNNAIGSSLNVTNKDMDSTLMSYISALDSGGKLYLRARIYNTDNSLASSWSNAVTVQLSKQPMVKFYLPDEEVYAIAKTVNGPKVYTAKVPKSFFRNDSTQGGWKNAIMGDKLAAFFNLPGQVKDPMNKNGFYPATKVNSIVGYLEILPTTIYGLSEVDGATFRFQTISSTDFEQEDFFNSYTPFDWSYYLENVNLDPIANLSTTINIQIPEAVCDTEYVINITDSSGVKPQEKIQFLIPKSIVDNSSISNGDEPSMKDAVNMLDWIYQKGKYVSGNTSFINSMRWQIGSYNGGRFYSIGLIDPNDNLVAYLDSNASTGLLNLRLNTHYGGWSYVRETGNWTTYQEDHKDLLGKKDPTVYIKI